MKPVSSNPNLYLYPYSYTNLILAAILVMLATACQEPVQVQPLDATPSGIIGDNNLSKPEPFKSFFKAIGQMHSGCTATHLGSGYALTAAHCLGGPTQGIEYKKPCDANAHGIVWGRIHGQPTTPINSVCLEIVLREYTDTHDYAVILVSNTPQEFIKPDFAPIQELEDVAVFSHPSGRPLEWSGPCTILDVDVQSANIHHNCDTEQGSSGAPILNTSDELVGIHTFGLIGKNGGTAVHNTALEELY